MKILLHDCCAPCGAYVLEKLLEDGHDVAVYFFNPNIYPRKEHDWRKDEMKQFCEARGVKFFQENYDRQEWLSEIKGLEQVPERGDRCAICFSHRLNKTALKAEELKVEALATTLTISPLKNAEQINEIGHQIATKYNLRFIDMIWRKNDGYKKACELSAEQGFHRQNYCGCEFSMPKE